MWSSGRCQKISHRLDAQTLHETVFDIRRTLGRTPCRPLCINNGDDNPWARLPQSAGESVFKHLLRLDGLNLLKTGALRQLGQVRAKGGMRRLPASELKLAIIPDNVNKILGGSRRGCGE